MRFLSGISYYTACLCGALAADGEVSTILMRRLLPGRLYPGHARVGAPLSRLRIPDRVRVFDGVDWFWIPSIFGAAWFLLRRRPGHVVFQWWTGAVLHSYLALAVIARLVGARVVLECHEVQDVGEAELGWVRTYVRRVAPLLFAQASRVVVHSAHDRDAISAHYRLDPDDVLVIPHATYANYGDGARRIEHERCNLLYFGVIRPFKGLETLVEAFDLLPPAVAEEYRLTVIGETWEGWTLPAELIARSRYRDRITFVNRYVNDEEVHAAFAAADIVVLPYRRSSQSGPLHVAMHYGLPVVVSAVGGLVEAVEEYEGAVLVDPGDPAALADAIRRARGLVGRRFHNQNGWTKTAERYRQVFADDRGGSRARHDAPTQPAGAENA
jgi:glycosyltransferase involved in cell wall biosynthesis